jgi:hypothetical protein
LVGKANKTIYCLLPFLFVSVDGQLPNRDLSGDDQPHLGDDAQRV